MDFQQSEDYEGDNLMALKYTGTGFLPDIPARDLTDEEVAQHGGAEALIATGLYSAGKAPEVPSMGVVGKPAPTTLRRIGDPMPKDGE